MIDIPFGYTGEQLVACAARELALRERVYPRWVGQKRMTASQALEQTTMMRAIVAVLRQLPASPPAQPDLFGVGGRK